MVYDKKIGNVSISKSQYLKFLLSSLRVVKKNVSPECYISILLLQNSPWISEPVYFAAISEH